MRIFKLIKKYPESPKTLGLKIYENGNFYSSRFATENVEHFHKIKTQFNPAYYPEHWKEVTNMLFDIVSFIGGKNNKTILTYGGESCIHRTDDINTSNTWSKSRCLEDGLKINSVKRLHDNVIFTVGDTVVRHADEYCENPSTTPRTINRLYLREETVYFDTTPTDTGFVLSLFSHTEKPKEDAYEILSYYAKNISGKGDDYVDPTYIWTETHKGNGQWSRGGYITKPYSTSEIESHNGYGIHSVKRISDGEVFTMGDNTEDGKVIEIYLNGTDIFLRFEPSPIQHSRILKYCRKIKPLTITTDDGVEIKEGDYCYLVYLPLNNVVKDPQATKFRKELLPNPSYRLIFSEEKVARDYLLFNRPMLSINDLLNYLKSQDLEVEIIDPKFIKFIKEKK